jgi:hypothetical protein
LDGARHHPVNNDNLSACPSARRLQKNIFLDSPPEKPQAMQDIPPEYMQKLSGFDKKEERVELRTLLYSFLTPALLFQYAFNR